MQITVAGDQYLIRCSPLDLGKVRSLPSRRFDGKLNAWLAPFTTETYAAMRQLGFDVAHLQVPSHSGYQITTHKNALLLRTPGGPVNVDKCQRIPDYRGWNANVAAWVVKASKVNVLYLLEQFPKEAWDLSAIELIAPLVGEETLRETLVDEKAQLKNSTEPVVIDDFKFKTKPFQHQAKSFKLSRDLDAFALLMEQGTGKSKVACDVVAWKFLQHKINAWLIICPNSLKDVWAGDEIPTHLPDYVTNELIVWRSGMPKTERDKLDTWLVTKPKPGVLRIFIVNVEALSHDRALNICKKFLARHNAHATVDESSRIKTPNSKRTRNIIKLSPLTISRNILTGTPVTQGPLDVFAQFKFLDEKILGFSSYAAFRNRYAIMGGFNGKQITSYQNVDELQRNLDPYMFRVLRADCLDLPPKMYQKRTLELNPEQRVLYDQMKDEMAVELEGQQINTTMVLTQMLRLQQITGGFLPADQSAEKAEGESKVRKVRDYVDILPIPGDNPKIDALLDVAEEVQGKMIVWARFRAELDLIARSLEAIYGVGSVVEFHGGITEHGRADARRLFQDPASRVRFFVGQTETGGVGLTLTQAKTVVYFSNSFSLESRLQSEDRAHRIGQTGTVMYIDLVAKNTLDTKVLAALRGKKNLANAITGDNFTQWL